jgi:hypothetical protein
VELHPVLSANFVYLGQFDFGQAFISDFFQTIVANKIVAIPIINRIIVGVKLPESGIVGATVAEGVEIIVGVFVAVILGVVVAVGVGVFVAVGETDIVAEGVAINEGFSDASTTNVLVNFLRIPAASRHVIVTV